MVGGGIKIINSASNDFLFSDLYDDHVLTEFLYRMTLSISYLFSDVSKGSNLGHFIGLASLGLFLNWTGGVPCPDNFCWFAKLTTCKL